MNGRTLLETNIAISLFANEAETNIPRTTSGLQRWQFNTI
jgi:hypothetical protein